MKINDLTTILDQQSNASKKTEKSTQNNFMQILNEKLGSKDTKTSYPGVSPTVSQTPFINLTAPLNAITGINNSGAQMTIDRVDQALGLLEQYQAALSDPDSSLKDMAQTVDAMERQADDIQTLLPSMSEDPEGSDLLEKVSTLMKVEAMKFKRGDYL